MRPLIKDSRSADLDLGATNGHQTLNVEFTEPVFVNVYGDQESIPRIRFRQAGNRFLLGSSKGLQTRALVFNRVYRLEIQSVMLVFPTPLVN
jgi:hypothetical protein